MIDSLFLGAGSRREQDVLLLISENVDVKSSEIASRLQLSSAYFPFAMQLLTRVINKGIDATCESIFPELRADFEAEASSLMTNFVATRFQTYFSIMKRSPLFEQVYAQPRNFEVFHYSQADRDKASRELLKQGETPHYDSPFKVYLPAAEHSMVALSDLALVFRQLTFEHHQKFVLANYNWHLNAYISRLVDKFKDDINDFSMNDLKRNLGFKDVLRSDYSYARFLLLVGLPGEEASINHLPRDEFLQALGSAYGQLQPSNIPVEAFKEDKYVAIAENCALVLSCFARAKVSFSKDFEAMLSCV